MKITIIILHEYLFYFFWMALNKKIRSHAKCKLNERKQGNRWSISLPLLRPVATCCRLSRVGVRQVYGLGLHPASAEGWLNRKSNESLQHFIDEPLLWMNGFHYHSLNSINSLIRLLLLIRFFSINNLFLMVYLFVWSCLFSQQPTNKHFVVFQFRSCMIAI